jgi:hypothetical protein
MPIARGQKGVAQEMRKFAAGKLHSGSKSGPVVKSRKQAIAIALSEAGLSRKKSSSMRGAPPAEGYRHLGRFQTGKARKEYPRP